MPRMSKAAMALCDDIRNNGHQMTPETPDRGRSLYVATDYNNDECDTPSKDEVAPTTIKKRRRRRSKAAPATEVKSPSKNGIFTVEIVGGIGLPGYPLNEGEKLVVAKLVPVKVRA